MATRPNITNPSAIDRSAVVTFSSPEQFFAAVLGPVQHDAHVTVRRQHRWLEAQRRANREAGARLSEAVAEIIATRRANVEAHRAASEVNPASVRRAA